LENEDENLTYPELIDYLKEIGNKDDGQLTKIYEKQRGVWMGNHQDKTEIVLSTMHKVKGLEYDCVIVPPSFSSLPIKNEGLTSYQIAELIEEERRLAYVAYTRAKFRLQIYLFHRELALRNSEPFEISKKEGQKLGVPAISDLKKLNIGWAAEFNSFNILRINEYLKKEIKAGTSVKVSGMQIYNESGKVIGKLSSKWLGTKNTFDYKGYIVNEIVVWTYDDSVKSDEKNNTTFANNWCQEAREKGYVYLVDFAGFGK